MTELFAKRGQMNWRSRMSEAGLLSVQVAEWCEAALIVGAGSVVLTIFTIICWRHIVGKKQS